MSHELNVNNGRYSFFSNRLPAWHELGQVVDRDVTDDEALKLAGLDWGVELMPLCRSDMTPIETHSCVVRSDNKETLGVVGAGYMPLQNVDLFKWMRGLQSIGKVTIETAGALRNGDTVWVLAKVDGLRFDIRGDAFQGYLSLTNGHAGNHKLLLTPTMIRQVCANTTRMITGQLRKNDLASGYELMHRNGLHENLEKIAELYKRTAEAWKRTQEAMTFLADKPLTEPKLVRLFTESFIPKKAVEQAPQQDAETIDTEDAEVEEVPAEAKDESVRAAAIRMEREKRLREILASPTCQLPGTRGTLFSGLQAVGEFCDFEINVRPKVVNARNTAEARLRSACMGGKGDDIKRRAFQVAMELAELSV